MPAENIDLNAVPRDPESASSNSFHGGDEKVLQFRSPFSLEGTE